MSNADAVIAVSTGMRNDFIDSYPDLDPNRVHVVRNGIDTTLFAPRDDPAALRRLGIDSALPTVLFVGRVTRQKGLAHLLRAARQLPAGVQLVVCASSPDEPAVAAEVAREMQELQAARPEVLWFDEPLARDDLVAVLSAATVFVCPSVYEPLGIVNLEAMACGTAVVASAVGGIPEVVADGSTGLLVPYDVAAPEAFEAGLTEAVTRLVGDPALAAKLGEAGRRRAVEEFGWPVVARTTVAVYSTVLAQT
jgi:starch synthase